MRRAAGAITAITAMAALVALVGLAAPVARAEEPARPRLVIHDHRYVPSELRVPAGQAVVIDVVNEDATAEEFESAELGVEKVIPAGRQAPVRIRPLAPGAYRFIGEYHPDTAAGTIVAEAEH